MMRYMKWINIFFFLLMVTINILANILPIGGKNTGEISADYPTLFTPAPFTFGIWFVIYLFMGAFVLFQSGIFNNTLAEIEMAIAIGPWFVITCLLNIIWIFCWHFDYIGFSTIAIAALLVSLIITVTKLDGATDCTLRCMLINYGFQIYLGWICAATIANISVFLVKIQWNRFGFSEQFWTVLILIVGALIGIALSAVGYHYLATLALVWAYFGILMKHMAFDGYNATYKPIIIVLLISIALMLISIGLAAPSGLSDRFRIENKST